MIKLEYEMENTLRVAIRASITAASVAIEELAQTRIYGFRLDDEDQGPNDVYGLRVFITAMPNSTAGYNPAIALEAQRDMSVEITYLAQPDNDIPRTVFVALENAVRSVFETVPVPFAMPTGVYFGAAMITGGGSSEFGDFGQAGGFTVEMKLSIT